MKGNADLCSASTIGKDQKFIGHSNKDNNHLLHLIFIRSVVIILFSHSVIQCTGKQEDKYSFNLCGICAPKQLFFRIVSSSTMDLKYCVMWEKVNCSILFGQLHIFNIFSAQYHLKGLV